MSESPMPSPLPWTLEISEQSSDDDAKWKIDDAKGRTLMDSERYYPSVPYKRADWDLILKSVNAHAALVEALTVLVDAVERHAYYYEDKLSDQSDEMNAARAALALAEPQK